MGPALALLEFDSIAAGIEAGDAMVKRAPLDRTVAGTVQPGRYLVLIVGEVAGVEEAVEAGRSAGGDSLIDEVLLPNVHPEVVAALSGARNSPGAEALGVIETHSSAAVIGAADAGRKGAAVAILDLRLADGLGGKGYVLFGGTVAEVEAAVAIGSAGVEPALVRRVVIPQLHGELADNLRSDPRFGPLVTGIGG